MEKMKGLNLLFSSAGLGNFERSRDRPQFRFPVVIIAIDPLPPCVPLLFKRAAALYP